MTELDDVRHRWRHIALVGDMAAGKTTIGRLLASKMGRPFLDSDEMIEKKTGKTTAEIAATSGISRLHDRELEVFLEMAGTATPAVLAPAASVVDCRDGREQLKACTTVWLVASEEALETRRGTGAHRRPVTTPEAFALRERRHPLIAEIAQARVDTSTITPEQTVEKLIQALIELS